jgi:hypothetical protein
MRTYHLSITVKALLPWNWVKKYKEDQKKLAFVGIVLPPPVS